MRVPVLLPLLPEVPRHVPVHYRLHDGDALARERREAAAARSAPVSAAAARAGRAGRGPGTRRTSPAPAPSLRPRRTFTLPPESGPNSAILLNILHRRGRRPQPRRAQLPPRPGPAPPQRSAALSPAAPAPASRHGGGAVPSRGAGWPRAPARPPPRPTSGALMAERGAERREGVCGWWF